MQPKAESWKLARNELVRVTNTIPDDWNCSTDPVTGTGEEFFFMHKTNENRFVYVCIEDGIVTATESN